MTSTAVKCRCRNCNGHIEFDAQRAGEAIACPHCNMDTTLYIPGRAAIPIEHGKIAIPKRDNKAITALAVIMGITVVVIAVATYATSAVHSSPLEFISGGLGAILGLVLVVIALLTIILWILFPVFVYFAIGRFEKILHQIEENTRQR